MIVIITMHKSLAYVKMSWILVAHFTLQQLTTVSSTEIKIYIFESYDNAGGICDLWFCGCSHFLDWFFSCCCCCCFFIRKLRFWCLLEFAVSVLLPSQFPAKIKLHFQFSDFLFNVFFFRKYAPQRPQPCACLPRFCLQFWSKYISVLWFSVIFLYSFAVSNILQCPP